MNITKKTSLAAIATLCMASCGCTTETDSNADSLSGLTGRWNVVEVDGVRIENREAMPYINFTDSGTVNGYASVNNFSGLYTVSGDTISFEQMGITFMMGPDMDTEAAIMAAIGKWTRAEIKDSILNATDTEGNVVMTMKRD